MLHSPLFFLERKGNGKRLICVGSDISNAFGEYSSGSNGSIYGYALVAILIGFIQSMRIENSPKSSYIRMFRNGYDEF